MRGPHVWYRARRRVAGLAGTVLVGSVLGVAVLAPTSYLVLEQTAQSEFCKSCHIMDPFYESWENSPHRNVACVECHYEPGAVETVHGKWQALSQLAKYATRTQGTKPWAEVADQSCMRSGCHTIAGLEGPIDYAGVRFDHRPHFLENPLGGRLRCVTCHAQVVQTEHMAVDPRTCFTCHFMPGADGQPEAEASECTLCHAEPEAPVDVAGAPFVHADFLARGLECRACHTHVFEGDGTVREQRCRSCHGDPALFERLDDPRTLHRVHVSEHKVECFECHDEIHHGLVTSPAAHALGAEECTSCHADAHDVAALMYSGRGASGVEERPSRMLTTLVGCEDCHTGRSGAGGDALRGVAAAGEVDCIHCHGPSVHGMLAGWQTTVGETLANLRPMLDAQRSRADGAGQEEARALLDAAAGDLALLEADGSRGAHNVGYALAALRASAERIDRADALLGRTSDATAAAALPFVSPSGCSECHLGAERLPSLDVHGRPFSHELHVVAAQLDCATCHSVEQHGAPAFPRNQCGTCHHQESERNDPTNCANCHPVQASFLAGVVEGVEETPSGMEDKECTVCHGEPPDLFRPQMALCALCHDEEFVAKAQGQRAELGHLHVRIEEALAAARRTGGREGELAALRRQALELVERDGSFGAHNPALTKALLEKALEQIERR